MYRPFFAQMSKQLGQLETWLDAAVTHATTRGYDADVLLTQRLAPDQFPLGRQIQITCDTAKLGAARLTGKDAPPHADTETTIEGLRPRLRAVREYLDALTEADLAEAATRSVTQPRWEGKTLSGADYFVAHAVPNFYFHLAHVYALLRHAGVPLGKRDYLGAMPYRPAP